MTEYNWDRIPPEMRTMLLKLTTLSESMSFTKWNGFTLEEKTKLNKALYGKTDGTAKFCER